MSSFAIGCDIGGTFTDTVVVDRERGTVRQYKAPTTPANVHDGIFETLRMAAAEEQVSLEDLLASTRSFSHGTTVATNAFLQRKGAHTGLIQTRGFGDTLAIMRAGGRAAGRNEEEMKRFSTLFKPLPIVPPDRIAEVDERVDFKGRVLAPLLEEDARRAVRQLLERGVTSFAICLLWAFRNPEHERLLARVVAEMAPDAYVSVSSELLPRIKEYERTATTAINSYIGPVVRSSLGSLGGELDRHGLEAAPLLMQSNGGLTDLDESIERAATTLMSGPAGGVAGAARLGRAIGYPNIVTTDMGGTTFDVGLVVDGRPAMLTETILGQYPIALPSIGINAIGAGGGSIARVRHGYLGVGPESAGADPGPACYARGGTEPTVTDANVVLGIVDPESFLGGSLPLDREAAEAAVRRGVAEPLGLSVMGAAEAIRTVTDAKMSDLIRRVTIQRGHDPRDFVLFAYGGGGPMHATSYGADVGAQAVIVPSTASVHSAMGIAAADLGVTFERSVPMVVPAGERNAREHLPVGELNAALAALGEQAREVLRRRGAEQVELRFLADMRLRGQIHELAVDLPAEQLSEEQVDALPAAFLAAYEEHFGPGSAFPQAGLELMTIRVEGWSPSDLSLPEAEEGLRREVVADRSRTVHMPPEGPIEAAVLDGTALLPGDFVNGPAVIELPGTAVLVSSGETATVDRLASIVIERRTER